MSRKRSELIAWLLGVLIASLVMAAAFGLCTVAYDTNDDTSMLRTYMGFRVEEPQVYHRFLEPWLTGLLVALGRLWPGQAWFSWWQLAMLWLSAVVIVKNACVIAVRAGRPMALGAGLGALFTVGCAFLCYVRVTFTATAALLGAAATSEALGLPADAPFGKTLRGWLACWLLLTASAVTRKETALVAAIFCGGIFVVRALERAGRLDASPKRSLRPMACALCAAAALLFGMIGTRAAVETPRTRAYEAWQSAFSGLIDYCDLRDLTPADYAPYGWTPEELPLLGMYYTLDENISTEALQALTQTLKARAASEGRFAALGRAARALWAHDRGSVLSMGGMLCAFALCLIGLGRRAGARGPRLILWGSLLAAAALLGYLALEGRMPLRAIQTVLFPASVTWLLLAAECLPQSGVVRKTASALLLAGMLLLDGCYAISVYQDNRKPTEEALLEAPADVYAEMDSFALSEPDILIVNGLEFALDNRLFPDVSEGVPRNIAFWGGWLARSPEQREQFARFGIDADHFTAEDFLRENVYYATGRVDPPPEELLAYARSQLPGQDIQIDLVDEYGSTYYFQLWRAE